MTRSLLNIVTLLLITSFSAVCFAEDDAEPGDVHTPIGCRCGRPFGRITRVQNYEVERRRYSNGQGSVQATN